MDELQRYVDILFADYRQYEDANVLRIQMLDELLTEKEQLQLQGQSEKEAIRAVLASLDEFGAPAEGNRLIYFNRFRHESNTALLLWLLAALVLSVPLLILGHFLVSIAVFLAVAVCFVFWLRSEPLRENNEVAFYDMDQVKQLSKKIWIWWAILTVVWLVGVTLFNSEAFPLGSPVAFGGLYGVALTAARYYLPLILIVLPLWASARTRIMLKNEVGAEDHNHE